MSGDVVFADLIDADPAPRELATIGKRYIAAQASYVWVVFAVLFLVLPGVFALAVFGSSAGVGYLVGGLALAVGLGYWTSRKRAALRKVLVEGTQRPARLVDVSHLVVRQGLASSRRVTLHVEVDGKRARCVSWAGDLEEAERDAWIRVLVHPQVPGVVVPVVSVT